MTKRCIKTLAAVGVLNGVAGGLLVASRVVGDTVELKFGHESGLEVVDIRFSGKSVASPCGGLLPSAAARAGTSNVLSFRCHIYLKKDVHSELFPEFGV